MLFYFSELYFLSNIDYRMSSLYFIIILTRKKFTLNAKELAWNALDVWDGGTKWPCYILPCNTRILSI